MICAYILIKQFPTLSVHCSDPLLDDIRDSEFKKTSYKEQKKINQEINWYLDEMEMRLKKC